jgi:hypothetical protein
VAAPVDPAAGLEARVSPRRRTGSLASQRSHSVPSIPADHLSTAIAAMPGILGPALTTDFDPPSPNRRSGQVFGSRYNFGTSLNVPGQPAPTSSSAGGRRPLFHKESGVPVTGGRATVNTAGKPVDTSKSVSTAPVSTPSPTPADLLSGKPDHQSASYQELVNKYCFVSYAPLRALRSDQCTNSRYSMAPPIRSHRRQVGQPGVLAGVETKDRKLALLPCLTTRP